MSNKISSISVFLLALLNFYSLQAQHRDIHKINPKDEVVLKTIFATINANDSLQARKFITENCTPHFRDIVPMKGHQEAFLNFYLQTGGLILDSTSVKLTQEKYLTSLYCHDKNFSLYHTITADFTPDHKVNGLKISPTRLEDLHLKSLDHETFKNEITEILKNSCSTDAFSGVVLVAKGSQILFQQACGEASKSYHIANKIDTKFNLGSMNKMFTAISVMQLWEQGKIKLSDPISKFVDDSWLPKKITDKIKIQHLLTHTSGLGSYFNETFFNSSRELFRKVDDYKPLIKNDSLHFEPGSKYEYSNTGMLLLGVAIEKVSGKDYFDYIRNNIYKPAGMLHSDSYELDQPIENMAVGYIKTDKGFENNTFKHVLKGGPAGGGYATAPDLQKFALSLMDGKLVSKTTLEKMFEDDLGNGYGFGFEIKKIDSEKVIGHSGGFPGINSNLEIYSNKGYISIVLSNYDSGHFIADKIRELIYRLEK